MTNWSAKPGSDVRTLLVRYGLLVLLLAIGSVPAHGAQTSSLDQAREALESGRVEEAHRLADAALQRAPRNPQAHLVFGSALLLQGRRDEAEKSFEFALALDPSVEPELGRAYLRAAEHFLDASELETAEAYALRAAEHDPELEGRGVEMLFADALARFRAGDDAGDALVGRWLSRFPDYVPRSEEEIFVLASYHEASGKRQKAARLYARCAEEYPEGELGGRAAELLLSRKVTIDRLVSVPCSARLFVKLRSIELGYDATRVAVSFVWVSDDRANVPKQRLRLLNESRIEAGGGETLPIQIGTGRSRRGKSLELSADTLHHVNLKFPPVSRDRETITLVLENDLCGTSGRRGRYALRFAALPTSNATAGGADGSGARTQKVPALHLHNYFIAAGRCTGTLIFSPDGITYRADRHGFELLCEDVIHVAPRRKFIAEDPFDRIGQTGEVPTLEIKGRVTTDKGERKTETWRFLAEDGTPPVLLRSKNPCRNGR